MDILALYDVLDQINFKDMCRTCYSKASEYTLFSKVHGIFSGIDYKLRLKTSLNEFKKSEMKSSIFSNHNAMKLEINYTHIHTHTKEKTQKYGN